jgi:hypothetical protein
MQRSKNIDPSQNFQTVKPRSGSMTSVDFGNLHTGDLDG